MSKELMFERFVKQALKFPERTAVEYYGASKEKKCTTYGELLTKAVVTANALKKYVTKKNESIAVMMQRGTEQIVSVLAIQMSGCAYIPIRTTQPDERVRKIIKAADVRIMITESEDSASRYDDISVLNFSDISGKNEIPVNKAAEMIEKPDTSDTAYIIFTSGSTGEPKGVAISHEACMNTICDINNRFDISSDDAAINVSSYDFDLSVYDFFGMLSAGGKIIVIDDAVSKEPSVWEKAVADSNATLWNSVPAIFEMFCRYRKYNLPKSLRYILLSGDWVSKKLYFNIKSCNPSLRFAALGGATEASIWSNIYELSEKDRASTWEFVPYGKALSGQEYMIADESGKECIKGTTGELYIGGKGLAKFYAGASDITAERFVTLDGKRWYKTGDAGYLDDNNDIIFCGRLDNQVKINGYRIELGEIETVLCKLPEVISGACVKAENKSKTFIGAVVIPKSDNVTVQEIKEKLKAELPSYMIPEIISFTDKIPLSPNGKTDRKKISLMISADGEKEIVETVTDTEKKLAEIWLGVLECSAVSRNDDFFELGGNSLTAVSILSAVEEVFGIELELGDIFSNPIFENMAKAIDEKIESGESEETVECEI